MSSPMSGQTGRGNGRIVFRTTGGHCVDVDISNQVSRLLGSDVFASVHVSGGDVAEAFRVELTDARRVFVKSHRSPPLHFFDTEAIGLQWLRSAAVDAGLLGVPEVLAASDDLLALEWIDQAQHRPDVATEAAFGRGLASIHRRSWPSFGREDRRTTGSRALPNEPCATWPEFFATQRLLPLARLASDQAALSSASIERLEGVAASLDQLVGSDELAVLLHGDLWAGNRVTDAAGRNWLIDPAAHGGHREFDLSMMRLFGGFGETCFEAYGAEFPLADGWMQRCAVHQLAPLVVHAIKFGGGYASAVERALDAAERLC